MASILGGSSGTFNSSNTIINKRVRIANETETSRPLCILCGNYAYGGGGRSCAERTVEQAELLETLPQLLPLLPVTRSLLCSYSCVDTYARAGVCVRVCWLVGWLIRCIAGLGGFCWLVVVVGVWVVTLDGVTADAPGVGRGGQWRGGGEML